MAARTHFYADFHPKARVRLWNRNTLRKATNEVQNLLHCMFTKPPVGQNRTAGARTVKTPTACKMLVFARRVSDLIISQKSAGGNTTVHFLKVAQDR
ncbi:uncharacterized [Tachysurus ichikawai]